MSYSLKTGIWKTLLNGVIVLAPSIISFIAQLPEEVTVKYTIPIGFLLYFLKNLIKNKNK